MSRRRKADLHRKNADRKGQGAFFGLWAWPLALALLTALGLISALVGDGVWDMVSALALGLPVAAGAWFGLRRGAR
jgi:hypothetical protein